MAGGFGFYGLGRLGLAFDLSRRFVSFRAFWLQILIKASRLGLGFGRGRV